jgi:hypothetical protein
MRFMMTRIMNHGLYLDVNMTAIGDGWTSMIERRAGKGVLCLSIYL